MSVSSRPQNASAAREQVIARFPVAIGVVAGGMRLLGVISPVQPPLVTSGPDGCPSGFPVGAPQGSRSGRARSKNPSPAVRSFRPVVLDGRRDRAGSTRTGGLHGPDREKCFARQRSPRRTRRGAGRGLGEVADRAVITAGDSTGFHVLVAEARDGYRWRSVASLSEPGFDADAWIGTLCVTSSGNRAVVAYAPRTFTNRPDLAIMKTARYGFCGPSALIGTSVRPELPDSVVSPTLRCRLDFWIGPVRRETIYARPLVTHGLLDQDVKPLEGGCGTHLTRRLV